LLSSASTPNPNLAPSVQAIQWQVDIFIACVDGLKGFREAIESVFPKTWVQLCVVHLVRNSLNYMGWKERKVVADLRKIYTSPTREAAEQKLERFAEKWDGKFPRIGQMWRCTWKRVAVFSPILKNTAG
jgi:putative transposase